MQAAFVSVGLGRNAFLHADDARALVLGPIDERPQEGRDEPEEEEDTSTPEGDQRASGVGEDADEAGDDVAASDDAAAAAAESGRPRRLPIEECVSEGQVILVQVTKDAVKGKGARLTTNLSIPGRHLVLTPFQAGIGISRRIEEEEERERLRSVMEGIAGPESGFIVRTASRGVGEDELAADARYLRALWADLRAEAKSPGEVPRSLYVDLDPVLRALRDQVNDEVSRVLIDDPVAYERACRFAARFMPEIADKIALYAERTPLFEAFHVEEAIDQALAAKVRLPSGGFLVIDTTEALTAIDVNTGRYVGLKDQEETVLRTNLEAATEIARQLRLRNLGGMIIADFIDMELADNRERLYQHLSEALSADRAVTTVLPMSELGLVQMTRKRTRESLIQTLQEACPSCAGTGRVKTAETIAYEIVRACARGMRLAAGSAVGRSGVEIIAAPEVADFLTDASNGLIEELEEVLCCRVYVRPDPAFMRERFEIVDR